MARCVAAATAVLCLALGGAAGRAQTDLDGFMREVLARRDENWKKLQQYILDEREVIDVRGPGRTPLWGDRREYTWFIRDGFFVRSPLRVNGVAIGEADRRKYEDDFLTREKRREERRRSGQAEPDAPRPADVEALLRQSREPEFVSSAYFLRFRFDEGRYALAGRETLDGHDVLKIEYYPTNLFRGTDRRRRDRDSAGHCVGAGCGTSDEDKAYDAEFRRLMNKTAVITLWIEPTRHQIVKYTFDNVALDFLPAQWLVHLDALHATMLMAQPFRASEDKQEAAVWLPRSIEFQGAMSLAAGQFDLRYNVDYHDYRRAGVTSKVTIPRGR
jgi:hypothetical protein